jgi:hypothetical protein
MTGFDQNSAVLSSMSFTLTLNPKLFASLPHSAAPHSIFFLPMQISPHLSDLSRDFWPSFPRALAPLGRKQSFVPGTIMLSMRPDSAGE